jgi:hypothetical protein
MNRTLLLSEACDKAGAVLFVTGVYLTLGAGAALTVAGILLMGYAYAIVQ